MRASPTADEGTSLPPPAFVLLDQSNIAALYAGNKCENCCSVAATGYPQPSVCSRGHTHTDTQAQTQRKTRRRKRAKYTRLQRRGRRCAANARLTGPMSTHRRRPARSAISLDRSPTQSLMNTVKMMATEMTVSLRSYCSGFTRGH
jgi:hypothetical protein